MMGKSNYQRNKLLDWFLRGQVFTPPATSYYALLTSTKGPRTNSTVYALNDTLSVIANDGLNHLYKCTTGGTTAAAQAALYPGAANEVIIDGTATFTEQDAAIRAGSACVEPVGGSYSRVAIAASLANWSGTQGAGTTAASTGTSGSSSNNVTVAFPAPTGQWGFMWGFALFDAPTGGNMYYPSPLVIAKTVNNGDAAPTFPANTLIINEG
jgi:hypothetical protein